MYNSGLDCCQLLKLLAIIAVLILAFGREVGACRAILVVLSVIIVCACKCGAPITPVSPYYGRRPVY